MVAIYRDYAEYTRKSRLTEEESKCQERFLWMEINFVLGKIGGHRLSSLGGRLIVVFSERDEILSVFENFKI